MWELEENLGDRPVLRSVKHYDMHKGKVPEGNPNTPHGYSFELAETLLPISISQRAAGNLLQLFLLLGAF